MEYNAYQPDNIYSYRKAEKENIKTIGKVAGLCVIAYVLLNNILTLPLVSISLRTLYKTNMIFQDSVTILLSVCCVLVPFYIGGRFLKKKQHCETLPLEKPYDVKLAILAIFFGLFVCLMADFISSYFTTFIEHFGYKLNHSEFDVPSGFIGRAYYILTIAVVPALCEEVAIRGAIMQPLRRYGDIFAIVISSFVFAILHGNLIQLPFAFIAGIGLGYVTCITGSLWPSIIIHCLNNLYSCITGFMVKDLTGDTLNRVYFISLISLYVVTVFGSVIFFLYKGNRSLNKIRTYNSRKQRIVSFFGNAPMITALLIMLYLTSKYVTKV